MKKRRRKPREKKLTSGLTWISILIVVVGLSILLGGVVSPSFLENFNVGTTNPANNAQPATNCGPGQDNLQLCAFQFVTPTPTIAPPTPTSAPRPTNPPAPPGSPTPTKPPRTPTPEPPQTPTPRPPRPTSTPTPVGEPPPL